MKKLAFLGLVLVACGAGTSTEYQKTDTNISQSAGDRFSIVMPLSDSNSQSISCHIDRECNSDVAELKDIKIENNQMKFNFKAIGPGETEVGIECEGSLVENHTYTIVVD